MKHEKYLRYKNPVRTMETLRQKRFEESTYLRKRRREDELRRLREISGGWMRSEDEEEMPQQSSIFDPDIIASLDSDNKKRKLDALKQYHMQIKAAKETDSTMDDIIALGIVPLFSDALLVAEDCSELESIALTVLADVAGRVEGQFEEMFDNKLLSRLFKLFTSSSSGVLPNLLYLLATAINSSNEIRDMCLSHDIVQKTLNAWRRQPDIPIKRLAMTVLNSLYCWPIDVTEVSQLYLTVLKEIFEGADEPLIIDALNGLYNLSEISEKHVDLILAQFLPTICALCSSNNPNFVCAALPVISHIAVCGCTYTQILFECNMIEKLWSILSNASDSSLSDLRVAVSTTLSTILKTDSHNCSVVVERGYVFKFAKVLSNGQYRMRREAVMALHTILLNGSSQTVQHVIDWQEKNNTIITLLSDMLTVMDSEIVLATLECIDQIMMLDKFHEDNGIDSMHSFSNKQLMRQQGGLDKLEFLLGSQNMEVYILAHDIIENYFEESEDDASCEQEPDVLDVETSCVSF